jgi:hypothetical protein
MYRNQREATVKAAELNPGTTGLYDWVLQPGREEWHCNCPELAAGGPYTKETLPQTPHPNCDCQVVPRLKDDGVFLQQLNDYADGVDSPGGREIAAWVEKNGLGVEAEKGTWLPDGGPAAGGDGGAAKGTPKKSQGLEAPQATGYVNDFTHILRTQKISAGMYNSSLIQRFESGMEYARKAFVKWVKNDSIVYLNYTEELNESDGKFNPQNGKVYINKDKDMNNPRGVGSIYFHEYGHYIDFFAGNGNYLSNNSLFEKMIHSDFDIYLEQYMQKNSLTDKDSAYKIISKELKSQKSSSIWTISDLFGGLTDNKVIGNYKHARTYWTKPGALTREAFANMFSSMFYFESYASLKMYFPNALSEFERLLKGVL